MTATSFSFVLPTADRSHEVARKLNELGFVAAAVPELVAGFGHVVRVDDVSDQEWNDLLEVLAHHAPDARPIGR